jgi:hypothetical protein
VLPLHAWASHDTLAARGRRIDEPMGARNREHDRGTGARNRPVRRARVRHSGMFAGPADSSGRLTSASLRPRGPTSPNPAASTGTLARPDCPVINDEAGR